MLALTSFGITPEAWNAIIVAMVGSLGAFSISRFTAKRQADNDDVKDGRLFRGELRDDNTALRQELKDLKAERDALKERGDELETEMHLLQKERRERQLVDAEVRKRARVTDPGPTTNERSIREEADRITDARQGARFPELPDEHIPVKELEEEIDILQQERRVRQESDANVKKRARVTDPGPTTEERIDREKADRATDKRQGDRFPDPVDESEKPE